MQIHLEKCIKFFFCFNSVNEPLPQGLYAATLYKVITADHYNEEDDENIDFSTEVKKYFGGSLEGLIAWEDNVARMQLTWLGCTDR